MKLEKSNEEEISKSAEYSYAYARDVLKGRFKRGEEAISENAYFSHNYALEVLRGRFERGEKAISKYAYYSYYYVKEILKKENLSKEHAQEYLTRLNKLNKLKNHEKQ